MIRSFLINIHRNYHYYYPNDYDHPIMPSIIFSIILSMWLFIVDRIFFNKILFDYLGSIHKYAVGIPYISILIFTYLWYRNRLPSKQELRDFKKGMWLGIIVWILSIIGALIVSELF